MGEQPHLTELERKALTAWDECVPGYGFGFRKAAERSGTPPHLIRRVVRSLARKGMVAYERTLFFEDEPTISAGYVLTEQGKALLDG